MIVHLVGSYNESISRCTVHIMSKLSILMLSSHLIVNQVGFIIKFFRLRFLSFPFLALALSPESNLLDFARFQFYTVQLLKKQVF